MRKLLLAAFLCFAVSLGSFAQSTYKKVYDETINPLEQIDRALAKARAEDKYVVCQVGGNWCPWCLRFAAFVDADKEITKVINDNFVLIHTNYKPIRSSGATASAAAKGKETAPATQQANQAAALMERLDNPGRFGFPVFVVLNKQGKVIHIQDSSFLEEGKSYDRAKVLRFLRNWTPAAVEPRQ